MKVHEGTTVQGDNDLTEFFIGAVGSDEPIGPTGSGSAVFFVKIEKESGSKFSFINRLLLE